MKKKVKRSKGLTLARLSAAEAAAASAFFYAVNTIRVDGTER
jgi:hypothetical protein